MLYSVASFSGLIIYTIGIIIVLYRAHLDLRFGHAQSVREFRPFRTGQVFGLLESLLEREYLLPAKRGPRVLLLAVLLLVRIVHCNTLFEILIIIIMRYILNNNALYLCEFFIKKKKPQHYLSFDYIR